MSFRTVTLAAVVQSVSPHFGADPATGEHALSLGVTFGRDPSRQTGNVLAGELRLAREDAEALALVRGSLVMLDMTVRLAEPQIDPIVEAEVLAETRVAEPPVDWQGRALRAEAELAGLRADLEAFPVKVVSVLEEADAALPPAETQPPTASEPNGAAAEPPPQDPVPPSPPADEPAAPVGFTVEQKGMPGAEVRQAGSAEA